MRNENLPVISYHHVGEERGGEHPKHPYKYTTACLLVASTEYMCQHRVWLQYYCALKYFTSYWDTAWDHISKAGEIGLELLILLAGFKQADSMLFKHANSLVP
jgi:hypothetical protein